MNVGKEFGFLCLLGFPVCLLLKAFTHGISCIQSGTDRNFLTEQRLTEMVLNQDVLGVGEGEG